MQINKAPRSELKNRFVKNAIPREKDFADLIDAALSPKDDGIAKDGGGPLCLEIGKPIGAGDVRPALQLYGSFADTTHAWGLNVISTTARGRRGLAISDTAHRLFVEEGTGLIGIDTMTPDAKLHVNGAVRVDGVLTSRGLAWGDGGSRTEARPDAGLQGSAGAQSGFFQTANPERNYPPGASSWWHLLDVRHTSSENNYAMQFAGSFYDQGLWFRKTAGNPSTPWKQVVLADDQGDVKLTGNAGIAKTLTVGGLRWGHEGSRTETRSDAGLQGNAGAQSGFFQTERPEKNYPPGASGWWHLLDIRHANLANNYAMQLAGSFHDQGLWFRKTAGNPSTPWKQVVLADESGKLDVLSVKGTATVVGALSAESTTTLKGATTLESALNALGPVNLKGETTVSGKFTVQSETIEFGPLAKIKDKDKRLVTLYFRSRSGWSGGKYPVLHVMGAVLCSDVRSNSVYIRDSLSGNFGSFTGTLSAKTMNISETLTAKTKHFLIPHPLDAKKSLIHSSLEGPEIAVYYRGEASLKHGQATVSLPAYFEQLTRTEGRTVQVTPIFEGTEAIAALAASAVQNGAFKVRAIQPNNPSQRFYWEVKAIRKDVEPLNPEPPR